MNNFKNLREELTEDNNHNAALTVECLELERYDLIKDLAVLADLHLKLGYMNQEMIDSRIEIEKRLLNGN